jgi:hypothetical protein
MLIWKWIRFHWVRNLYMHQLILIYLMLVNEQHDPVRWSSVF